MPLRTSLFTTGLQYFHCSFLPACINCPQFIYTFMEYLSILYCLIDVRQSFCSDSKLFKNFLNAPSEPYPVVITLEKQNVH